MGDGYLPIRIHQHSFAIKLCLYTMVLKAIAKGGVWNRAI